MFRLFKLASFALLLIGTTHSQATAQSETTARAGRSALVVLIGGMDSDPTAAQIAGQSPRNEGNSGLYRLRGDLQAPNIVTEYFNWNGTRARQINSKPVPQAASIASTIRRHVNQHPRDLVIVVGNSWGGHTAWEVCQTLVDSPTPIAIDYVVFLDPSSTGRANEARPKHLPININQATNFYTRNVFGWRKWPKEARLENIDLGDAKHGFMNPDGPAYDSTLDFNAHVAAEWDERIHAAIHQKITDLVGSPRPANSAGQLATKRQTAP